MSENVKCPECGSLACNGPMEFECGSYMPAWGDLCIQQSESCKTIASIKAELEKANEKNRALEIEIGPLREMREEVSKTTMVLKSMAHMEYRMIRARCLRFLRVWAKATAKIKREKMK